MKNGFTLLELVVTLIIVTVLISVAIPYYLSAVESARMTEVVMLWGKQKNWASGQILSEQQAQRFTRRLLTQANLKYFTGQIVCREKQNPEELCWEAEFTQVKENPHVQYKLITTHNFTHLACVPLNDAGEDFCMSQAVDEKTPEQVGGEKAYWIK